MGVESILAVFLRHAQLHPRASHRPKPDDAVAGQDKKRGDGETAGGDYPPGTGRWRAQRRPDQRGVERLRLQHEEAGGAASFFALARMAVHA